MGVTINCSSVPTSLLHDGERGQPMVTTTMTTNTPGTM
jgi:hypothetical protein